MTTAKRNSWGRVYAAHRRAYTPRVWPIAIVSASVAVVAVQLHPLAPVLDVLVGVVVAVVLSSLRWAIWRRRHPVITPEQYAADWREAMRRAARWN